MTAAITIHFRKPELTRKCIYSLLMDGWGPILVWDNSDDGGVSLHELEATYASESRVHLVRSPANLGFGKGMNAALKELGRRGYSGPVLLVNNDAQVLPGMRPALLAALLEGDEIQVVAPRTVQDGREQGWLHYQRWLGLVTRRPVPASFPYLSGCCLLIGRPDNSCPLFDEAFFMYGEDVELSWRVRRAGGRLVLLNQAFVTHEGSASSGQASETYERYLVASHWLLANKLASGVASAQLMRALRIPMLFMRAWVRVIRYRSLTPLFALFQVSRTARIPNHN